MNVVLERDAICPRCRGVVPLPSEVRWISQLRIYKPQATCSGCGIGYSWHTSRNPVRGQHDLYNGMIDTWFGDKPLRGMHPVVKEEESA